MDHSYVCLPVDIETELQQSKEALDKAKETIGGKNKVIKSLREKLRRRDNTISSILAEMEDLKLLSSREYDLLKLNFDKATLTLIENEIKASNQSKHARRYTEEVKNFAVTLHYYSAQAYEYVRKFLTLPHPSTIRQWASSRNCSPGFLSEVLETLKKDMAEDRRDVVVMFDAMHLKKAYSFDTGSQTYVGSVNYGHLHTGCEDSLATEALVVMVVGMKKHFKHPIGYFLIDKISGGTQAQIVRDAISLVTEAGHSVIAVVCDGNYSNQATATALGCDFSDPTNIKSHFTNPVTQENVFFCFDACHLMKNIRNCLGDHRTILWGEQEINWQYICELNHIQQKDNLVLANKLRGKHINFGQNKMNVQLACQTLSSSVASAIDFLREDLHLPQFADSQATTHFIQIFDRIFDFCNSSSPQAKGYKSPITEHNLYIKEQVASETCNYIIGLMDKDGKPMVKGRRKTGFVGFLCTIKSTIEIAKILLSKPGYRYFLTHRLSQDHLETFFSRIRRHHGWNNNPTPLQFKWALRALLLKNGVLASGRANSVSIPEAENTLLEEVSEAPLTNPMLSTFIETLRSPTEYHEHVLHYISGYISRTVAGKVKCAKCSAALLNSDEHEERNQNSLFTQRKSNGGLLFSNNMFLVVSACDKALREILTGPQGPVKAVTPSITAIVTRHVLECVSTRVFPQIWKHSMENQHIATEDNHVHQVIKEACRLYCRMIFHHHERLIQDRYINSDIGTRRHKLTKAVIFLHQ